MESDYLQPFVIEEPGKDESGIVVLQAGLGVASELELVVVSGGPVFLFKGAMSADECYDATHSKSPSFHLAAGQGMVVSRCFMPPSVGQFTIAADSASVGYFRQVSRLRNPGEAA